MCRDPGEFSVIKSDSGLGMQLAADRALPCVRPWVQSLILEREKKVSN